jgi:TRAP transporter TAXI family solute receptor
MSGIFANRPGRLLSRWAGRVAILYALGFAAGPAAAQTLGFATLQPGSLNHTSASAIAKVLKDKAGMNILVQPTAGDTVILPMVNRGEAQFGNGNSLELHNAYEGRGPGGKMTDLRVIAAIHTLRTAFWVRKDAPMQTIADLRGKRVVMGYSAMPTIDVITQAILATAGLTEKDVKPVLVPNVVRGADDFISGAADMYFFAFGAPKVREVDATVGGTRVLIHEVGLPHSGCAGSDFRRRTQADAGLQLRQHDFHERQGEGRGRVQAAGDSGAEQERSGRDPARIT